MALAKVKTREVSAHSECRRALGKKMTSEQRKNGTGRDRTGSIRKRQGKSDEKRRVARTDCCSKPALRMILDDNLPAQPTSLVDCGIGDQIQRRCCVGSSG